jgi:hypothetical protein
MRLNEIRFLFRIKSGSSPKYISQISVNTTFGSINLNKIRFASEFHEQTLTVVGV